MKILNAILLWVALVFVVPLMGTQLVWYLHQRSVEYPVLTEVPGSANPTPRFYSKAIPWTGLSICFGLSAVGVIAFLRYGQRTISSPIRQCVHVTFEIAKGNFDQHIPVETHNEIGEIQTLFNYMSAQLKGYNAENIKLLSRLKKGYIDTIKALVNSIDAKDPYTRGHSVRVSQYSVEIGKELGLNDDELMMLEYAATLHDVGKIGIDERILRKTSKLDPAEYSLIKQHPLMAISIIDPIEFLAPVKPIIRHHHERYDGLGYPDGLKGDQIPLGSKIINIADAYDAMTSQRTYNSPMDIEEAIRNLEKIRGIQTDPTVSDAFIRVLRKKVLFSSDLSADLPVEEPALRSVASSIV